MKWTKAPLSQRQLLSTLKRMTTAGMTSSSKQSGWYRKQEEPQQACSSGSSKWGTLALHGSWTSWKTRALWALPTAQNPGRGTSILWQRSDVFQRFPTLTVNLSPLSMVQFFHEAPHWNEQCRKSHRDRRVSP